MKINIVTSAGKAKTLLGAFDRALVNAGIANMNLIYLSSVIPKDAEITFGKPKILEKDFGKKLYVVMAKRETNKKEKIAAGVGWVTEKNNRFGLFVEHDGANKEEVKDLIIQTLTGMMISRKNYEFSRIQYAISEATNQEGEASCAISAAVYEIDGWNS